MSNALSKTPKQLVGFTMEGIGRPVLGRLWQFTCPQCGETIPVRWKNGSKLYTRKQAKDALNAHLGIGRKWTNVRCKGRPGSETATG